jgi:hypothetical protein
MLAAGGALAIVATTSTAGAPPANASLCQPRVYSIVWDGWQGTLQLCSENGDASWLQQGVTRYKVTYKAGQILTGYGHRILMKVDFAGTPDNTLDDQLFDGYFFTQQVAQTRGMAGITYWQGIPFGFYALRVR